MLIANEAAQGGAGSTLLVDSLSVQLAVHILGRHAHVLFREPTGHEGLTFHQERIVRDYIHAHLRERMSLDDLAAQVALTRFHFARRFRQSMGTSPHEFVVQQRVAKARTLLARTSTPLHDIAFSCGFADQSHMTRVFKKRTGMTPGQFRGRS